MTVAGTGVGYYHVNVVLGRHAGRIVLVKFVTFGNARHKRQSSVYLRVEVTVDTDLYQ